MRSSLFWLVLSVLLSGTGLLTIALVDLVGAVQDSDQRALGQARREAEAIGGTLTTLLERVDFDVMVPQSNHFEIGDEELVLLQEVGWLHDPPATYSEAALPVLALLALQAARYAEIVAHDRDLARTELAAAMATEELSERDEDYLLVEAAWQVREGARKEIKVAAIASLGTLGEAETLPFLVQMMGDADAQIAAAAKAAVDKINSKPPDKK